MDNVIYIIQNIGFPIFICLYFMFRFEKIISNNTKILKELEKKIEKKN